MLAVRYTWGGGCYNPSVSTAHEANKFISQLAGGLAEKHSRTSATLPSLTADLVQLVHEAFALASVMGEDTTSCHLLVAALRRPDIATALAETGIDVKELATGLPQPDNLSLLQRLLVKIVPRHQPAADPTLWRAFCAAAEYALTCARSHVGILHVVVECLDSSSQAAACLERAGADRLKIRRFISHGKPEYAVTLPSGARAGDDVLIRVFNDDYSSRAFVTQVLRDHLRAPDPEGLMKYVHSGDDVRLGPFEAEAALALVRRIYLFASTAGQPLRLELCMHRR